MKTLLYILLLVTSLAYSQIDVPRYIAYQGVLIDKNKQLKPDGNYSIKFELYDSEFGGNMVWNKTFDPIKVTNGMFGELLGPFDANLKFDRQYFIQITVDNEQLSKRVPLTSSAYALGIANNSVSTEKIQNLAVTDSKIDNLTISTSKLKDFNVTETKLADNSVINRTIKTDAVETDKMKDKSVTEPKLADISVSKRTIQTDAIDSVKIKDKSISYNDLTTQSATNGNVLTFNNSTWQPQAPSGVPVGTIVAFYGNENQIPNDWLLCDGNTVSASYPLLQQHLISLNSTAILPDLRGRFLRGNDSTIAKGRANNDPDYNSRTGSIKVGSIQPDAFQGHWHMWREQAIDPSNSSQNYRVNQSVWLRSLNADNVGSTDYSAHRAAGITSDAFVGNGPSGSPRTSSETRPKNIAVNWIIKAR